MEDLLTDEDLAKVEQHTFYVNMTLKERLKVRDNMEQIKMRHDDIKLNQSKVLRKVLIEFMNDDDFLKYIGVIK